MNTNDMTLKQMQSLYIRCSAIYHSGAGQESPLTDADFDALKRAICGKIGLGKHWAPLNWAGWKPNDASPLQLVAHRGFMGSIFNAYDYAARSEPEDLKWERGFADWHYRMSNEPVFATHKVDGVSVAIEYDNGQLKMALTRGDCINGENVTHHLLMMRDVPAIIDDPSHMVIRGEVVMFASDWEQYQKLHPEAKNARNMTSGILGRKEANDAVFLRFLPHGLDVLTSRSQRPYNTFEGMFDSLKQLGFCLPAGRICTTFESAKTFHDAAETGRDRLPYEIDGVVYAIDDRSRYAELGYDSGRCPYGAVAWKFPAMTGISTLNSLDVTVGHSGVLSPTGLIDGVLIGGVTVSRALLCNWEEIERLGIALGDRVVVSRRGDVIPKIVTLSSKGEHRQPIVEPTVCPVCGGPAGRQQLKGKLSANTFCLSPTTCPAQSTGKIMKWLSDIGVLNIGDKIVEAMVEAGIITDPADLYTITESELATMPFGKSIFGEKRARKAIAEMNKVRQVPLDKFLGALGVKGLGEGIAHNVREKAPGEFDTLADWIHPTKLLDAKDRVSLPNIAADIVKGLQHNRCLIVRLQGFVGVMEGSVAPAAQPAAGAGPKLKICLTGAMSKPRKEYEAAIIAAGMDVADDVNSTTTHLCQADVTSQSSKSKKAIKLGIPIISEATLLDMLDQLSPNPERTQAI